MIAVTFPVRYNTETCPIHGETTFSDYYVTMNRLEYGCLKCRFEEDCPACPPAGAPFQADLIHEED